MKVHFGGSLPGLTEYPDRYLLIRNTIRNLGYEIARDWIEIEKQGKKISQEEMFKKTLEAIESSGAIILENSRSSASVGQQMMLAVERNIPVLRLMYGLPQRSNLKGKFLTKSMSKLVEDKFYTEKTIEKNLDLFLKKAADNFGYARFNLVLERELDNYLRSKAKKNNSSKTEEIKKLINLDKSKTSQHNK